MPGKEDQNMAAETSFDYYYGDESSQFSIYRIPRQLITGERFKLLSTDAKLLYGLLLDRMGLSARNGWYDEQGRVYKDRFWADRTYPARPGPSNENICQALYHPRCPSPASRMRRPPQPLLGDNQHGLVALA